MHVSRRHIKPLFLPCIVYLDLCIHSLFFPCLCSSKILINFCPVCLRFIATWECSIHLQVSVCNLATDILWKDREEPNFAPQKNGKILLAY